MTATLFGHLNEQVYKFSMITTDVHYFLEEKGVRLFSLTTKTSIKTSMQWSVFFSSPQ